MICNICPRKCNIDRAVSHGYCGESDSVRLARAALHMWEEPCISGDRGSGAVFFTGCNMRCVFCQNSEIAHGNVGMEVTIDRLADIFLELECKGAANINLVTPSHYVVQIKEAMEKARALGLKIPFVYNTSSYEFPQTLQMLDGLVDIYLPDFKYMDASLSAKYSNAPDYPDVASAAISEMVRQISDRFGNEELCTFDEDGMMKHGVIVRHMILPGHTKDSIDVIRTLYEKYGDSVYISIMNQYTPLPHVKKYRELDRKVTRREYDKVVSAAIDMGVSNAYIQDGETGSDSFIPSFDYEGVR